MKCKNSHVHKSYGSFYTIWRLMRQRCRNKNNKYYGARGIKVCERWLNFDTFLKDMYGSYKRASKKYDGKLVSIERKDNDQGYHPTNCKWIPLKEQSKNRRYNNYFTYQGKTQTLAEWSRELGINYDSLRNRVVRRDDWTFGEAIKTRFRNRNQKIIQYTLNGKKLKVWLSIKEAAQEVGVHESNIIRAAQGKLKQSAGYLWEYL